MAMLEYVKAFREKVGNMPIVVCAASVIVENSAGEILLQLRNDNNCWAYPGGAVDVDEEVEQTAARELHDETGLKANALEFFGVFSGTDMHHIYPNGHEISNVDIVFVCRDYEGAATPDYAESDELKFFSRQELPQNISPPCIRALERFLEKP